MHAETHHAEPAHVEKVAAFVTRDVERGGTRVRELLVFRHDNPLAGIQVPAGTLEPPESPREAVLREVAEEAGLTDVRPVGEPLRAPLEIADDEWYLVLDPAGRETMRRLALGRPAVRIAHREGRRVFLRGWLEDDSPCEWWADASSLTRDVRRWLFHLEVTGPVADRWERAYDGPRPWSFYWVPLDADPGLIGKMAEWLELMRPRLRPA